MLNTTALKILFRSRSLSFARNCVLQKKPDGELAAFKWKGKDIYYRPGTSDARLIYKILLYPLRRSEYWIGADINPRVIFDIGGNIGASSIYFANLYPEATIYTFEPVPENFSILKANTGQYANIKAFCTALGSEDGRIEFSSSDCPTNMGGFSSCDIGVDKSNRFEVSVKKPSTVMKELGIEAVDLIKIDTEGAEYPIMTSFDRDVLRKVQWITGELHGVKDFELLAYLAEDFEISTKKGFKRLFNFSACNRGLLKGSKAS